MRARGNLRQMRDRQYLVMASDASHECTDLPRNSTTNPCVDLVKHERGCLLQLRQHRTQREHDACEFAARRNATEWSQLRANIERGEKGDRLCAEYTDVVERRHDHVDAAVWHAEFGKELRHFARELLGTACAKCA